MYCSQVRHGDETSDSSGETSSDDTVVPGDWGGLSNNWALVWSVEVICLSCDQGGLF